MFTNSQRKLLSTALGMANTLDVGTWYEYRDSEWQEMASRSFRNDAAQHHIPQDNNLDVAWQF
jgi:2C-methyl-D-erythritol 2,4-cyclodiphosphate synthase